MPTPSRTVSQVKSHLTKAQRATRAQAEKNQNSGETMTPSAAVRADPVAFDHYRKVRARLHAAGTDDALIENVINRYCIMLSEAEAQEIEISTFRALLREIEDHKDGQDFAAYISQAQGMAQTIQTARKQLNATRKMLLDIEDKNALTIASKLRSIPKKEAEAEPDPMASFLARRGTAPHL